MQTRNGSNSDTMERSTPSSVQLQATTPPTTAQPHPNPLLAAKGRIAPTPGNPKGYPPYELTNVHSFTNSQIVYYITNGQVTNFTTLQKAKKAHNKMFRSLGYNGNSNIDETVNQPT